MSDFEIVFISGVHGVGKGFLCSRINEEFGLPVFSASTLIKQLKKSEIDVNKQVIDVENNQDYLIMALNNLNPQSETILLDGHFCLNGSNGMIDVDIKTFKSMSLKSIITLYDNSEEISKRLLVRDGESLSIEAIDRLQKREIELAKITADQLNVKLHLASAKESLEDLSWIEKFL
ncbi:MAG: ATP-binding protein [Nitrososphaeraceae archaeon]